MENLHKYYGNKENNFENSEKQIKKKHHALQGNAGSIPGGGTKIPPVVGHPSPCVVNAEPVSHN